MSDYKLPPTLNRSKVFILQRSELEKRFDPFYYVPEIVELEKKVLAKNPKKLRHYVKGIASGATPKTTESEKYYTVEDDGIPFLRVQNLSPTGILEFEDCKYINVGTHNGMLKRSQVSAGDLLVKITGVGRMAVASVVPEGFEGNINQHICVIKTGSKELSETIAAFLNSDIGERLATRRSTGGTRPALDYPALLSIPIIEDSRILEITKEVVERSKQNEREAEKLLLGIGNYLQKLIGIALSEPIGNTLRNRMFYRQIGELTGNNRFDPNFHNDYFKAHIQAIQKHPHRQLKKVVNFSKEVWDQDSTFDTTFPYIEISEVDTKTGDIREIVSVEKLNAPSRAKMIVRPGDILVSLTRPNRGAIAAYDGSDICIASTGFAVIRRIETQTIIREYLFYVLRSQLCLIQMEQRSSGGNYPAITEEELGKILIPIPDIDRQQEIVRHVAATRTQAQELKDKTNAALAQASYEIEQLIISY